MKLNGAVPLKSCSLNSMQIWYLGKKELPAVQHPMVWQHWQKKARLESKLDASACISSALMHILQIVLHWHPFIQLSASLVPIYWTVFTIPGVFWTTDTVCYNCVIVIIAFSHGKYSNLTPLQLLCEISTNQMHFWVLNCMHCILVVPRHTTQHLDIMIQIFSWGTGTAKKLWS